MSSLPPRETDHIPSRLKTPSPDKRNRNLKVPVPILALIVVGVCCISSVWQQYDVVTTGTNDRVAGQQSTSRSAVNNRVDECKPLIASTGASAILVWAYDGPPDSRRLQDTLTSLPRGTTVQIFCGSTTCLERANRIRMMEQMTCLQIERLNVPELAKDTPLQTWAEHHILGKLLSGHWYEHHLQIAMQLTAAWKLGGILLQPGVIYQPRKSWGATDAVGTCQDRTVGEQGPKILGGFWGLFSPSPKSSKILGMMDQFLTEYRWEEPIRKRYNPANWPVNFSMDSLVAKSAIRRVSLASGCPGKTEFVDGYPGPTKYYGTLNYDERRKYLVEYLKNYGMNLGDETQGLAGIQALPRLDAFVERDRLEMVRFTDPETPPLIINKSSPDDGRRVQVFFNAWWGTKTMTWPPPYFIDPISLSMHVQPTPEIATIFRQGPEPKNKNTPVAPYLRSHAPIGARDTKTLQFLRDNGVHALFSACLTMTLSLPEVKRDGGVLIVDVDAAAQLKGKIPDSVLDGSTFYTQKLLGDDAEDNVLRFVLAFERLLAYSRARLVITNRLHVAMPCVALGTPVIFVHGKTLPGGGGNRMDGLDVFMHQMKDDQPMPKDFDWENPPANPQGQNFKKQVKRIQQLSTCHSGISDPSRKFGVVPTDWNFGEAAEEEEACTEESTWSVNPDAIHIAVGLDANLLDPVFPSWLNALAKSNPNEPIALYILSVKLSEKQRCLLRLMALKVLPNAKVFTIPTSVAEFEKSYNGHRRGHISIATQARLRLPSILPCVSKLFWIDLDAFVIGPIRKTWNEPTGACGIMARSSIVDYMQQNEKYHPSLKTWHRDYGKSFNAGIMLIDLQHLREMEFEEKIVRYWAAKIGANDQVTFNIACNATHGELDPRLNVFQGTSSDDTPPRSEWVIVHFQSNRKPWSGWNSSWSSQDFWDVWKQSKLTFEEVLDL